MEPDLTNESLTRKGKFSNLNRVTTFSKFLALLLFIALPFLGVWVGYSFAPEKVIEIETPVVVNDNEEVVEKVATTTPSQWYASAADDFAFNTETVNFTGVYQETDRTVWEDTETCHQLYLINYPQNDLHEYYVYKALSGNTVQSFNGNGLLLNLPWDEIPAADKEKIMNATGEPITISLRKKIESGRGASVCESFFSYEGLVE